LVKIEESDKFFISKMGAKFSGKPAVNVTKEIFS